MNEPKSSKLKEVYIYSTTQHSTSESDTVLSAVVYQIMSMSLRYQSHKGFHLI